ncbi:MAG: ATP-binding protein [Clostridia bacterium]|nr:ATP-binding protein [Clostridia bacterium]
MYSPFINKKGNPVTITQLKYSHLEQLKECDEGHHLEYKKILEDGGRAQLAKEIASFANCEGGWLIVGIDDKTKEIIPVDKCDYSQKVGKIACRISPMPEFETRFLSLPSDKTKGVLVIYVYEGRNAPYICNGSIYVRSGSSKESVKTADRGNIEYLYERSRSYTEEVEKFCKRDYYFSYNKVLQRGAVSPIASIYLKNISMKKNKYLNVYKNRDKIIDFITTTFQVFDHVSYSMESIIFMHKAVLPGSKGGTFIFELFYDWSCKILVPIGCTSTNQVEKFKEQFCQFGISEKAVENFNIADGTSVCNALFGGLHLFADLAKAYKLKEKDYAFCTEFENSGELVLAFWGDAFQNYINKYGVPYAHKEVNRCDIQYFRNGSNVMFSDLAASFLLDYIGAAFGYRSDSFGTIINESNYTVAME